MGNRILIIAAVASLGGGLSTLHAQIVAADPQGLDTPLTAQNAYNHTAVLNGATVYSKDEAAARTVNTNADRAGASHLQYFDNLLSSPALGMDGVAQDAPLDMNSIDLAPAALDLRGGAAGTMRTADAAGAGAGAGGGGSAGGGAGGDGSGQNDGSGSTTEGSQHASAVGTFHATSSTTPSDGNGSFLDLHANVPVGDPFSTTGSVNVSAAPPLSFSPTAAPASGAPTLTLGASTNVSLAQNGSLQPSNPHPLTETLENTSALDASAHEAAGASLGDPPASLSSVPEPGATAIIAAALLLFAASGRVYRKEL